MHSQAASNLECNSRQGWPDGHCNAHMQESHFLHRHMNIFIKEKEYALGINANLRARLFYPVDMRKFCTANGNTENKAEDTVNSNTNKSSQNPPKPETNQLVKVTTKGI